MSIRKNEDARIELVCVGGLDECEADPPTWMVDGRFDAEGKFEPHDGDDLLCPECEEQGEPADHDIDLADVD